MATNELMIEVKNLTKRYGEVRALDDISFEVKRGQVLGFLGPNGAGKTTTMKILTTFIAPSSGSAKVAGLDISEAPLEVRRKVGYLPESAPLYTDMQVIECLEFVAELRNISKPDRKTAIARVIETCGLKGMTGREIRTLSKGYKQRVGLAQAMIHDPSILILDEPTNGLDPNQIAEIRELIRSIGKERTVILSTHHLAEVQAAADRVLIIHKGKIVADGSPEELESSKGGARYDVTLATPQDGMKGVKEAFLGIPGVNEVDVPQTPKNGTLDIVVRGQRESDVRADIFRKVVERNWVMLGLGRKQVDLEAIFRRLTTETASIKEGGAQ
ncbi:MAG: ATP-binding cassette domain-containing protein [Myxococcota bacterium]|jgi:ABC-2 type transport system ATP-binding protein|nr:ATP-binding cassette domain-containing protein [Myxococcota bacterium]